MKKWMLMSLSTLLILSNTQVNQKKRLSKIIQNICGNSFAIVFMIVSTHLWRKKQKDVAEKE